MFVVVVLLVDKESLVGDVVVVVVGATTFSPTTGSAVGSIDGVIVSMVL